MKTNDIKKGTRIRLRNGWYGTMADNMRGNTRMVDVEGFAREIGSVYAHDILLVLVPLKGSKPLHTDIVYVEHTPAQFKLRKQLEAMGM